MISAAFSLNRIGFVFVHVENGGKLRVFFKLERGAPGCIKSSGCSKVKVMTRCHRDLPAAR